MNYQIQTLLTQIAARGVVSLDQLGRIESYVTPWLKDRAIIIWGRGDVETVAEELDIKLSEGQIHKVLEMIEDKHDATVGINWDTITDIVRQVQSWGNEGIFPTPIEEKKKFKIDMRVAHIAAKEIIDDWVNILMTNPNYKKGMTVEQWLSKCAEDSGVMHDTCDANMIFHDVLSRMGLIRDTPSPDNQQDTDIWNQVTFDHNLLEFYAGEVLEDYS